MGDSPAAELASFGPVEAGGVLQGACHRLTAAREEAGLPDPEAVGGLDSIEGVGVHGFR
jgi:hypothetical protein